MRCQLIFVLLFAASVYGSRSRRYTNVVHVAKSQNETSVRNVDLCFRYTWLKDLNVETFNASYLNKSCAEKFPNKPRPLCLDPMVVTENGEEPDVNWLFANMKSQTTCKRSGGYTCAKYTYRFNGEVLNVTRYCTKITVNEISMESGCVTSSNGAHETEVCACSEMIGNKPCNSAGVDTVFYPLIVVLLLNVITRFWT